MNKDKALKMAHKTFMQLNERSPRKDDGSGYFDKEINACKQALEQPSNMVAVPLDKLEDMQRRLSDCEEYLKENETPAECIARNRKDVSSSLKLLAKCMGEKKALATNKESSLVQPAQEPYAWATEWEDGEWSISHSPNMGKQSIPLYPHSTLDSTPAIEQALKEKNHG